MRSLLFFLATGIGMALPVLIYSAFGSSLMLTAGLLALIALFGALCLSIERTRAYREGGGGIE